MTTKKTSKKLNKGERFLTWKEQNEFFQKVYNELINSTNDNQKLEGWLSFVNGLVQEKGFTNTAILYNKFKDGQTHPEKLVWVATRNQFRKMDCHLKSWENLSPIELVRPMEVKDSDSLRWIVFQAYNYTQTAEAGSFTLDRFLDYYDIERRERFSLEKALSKTGLSEEEYLALLEKRVRNKVNSYQTKVGKTLSEHVLRYSISKNLGIGYEISAFNFDFLNETEAKEAIKALKLVDDIRNLMAY